MKKRWDETTDMERLLMAAKARYPHIRTFADIARHLDVSEQVLTNWKNRGIPAAQIFELSEEFCCNPRWLATRKGKMHEEHHNPLGIDWSCVSMGKCEHIKEVAEMSEEDFQNQERIFKAVVKTVRERKKQD